MAVVMPIEHRMDISKLMFLMDDGRLRTPSEFKRSVTCPEISLSPRKSQSTRLRTETSRSYPNAASPAVPSVPLNQNLHHSMPNGRTSKRSFQRTRTPKTAIAYYSPINKPDTPFSFSASFSRSTTNADFHTFSRQSTRIWSHSRPSTRATSNMDDTLACSLAVPTTAGSGGGGSRGTNKNKNKNTRKKTKRRTKSNSDPGALRQDSSMTSSQRKGSIGSAKSEQSEKSENSHTGTMFLEAAQKGDSGAVKQLLGATQFNPDSKTRYQSRSALHLACGYGQTSVVEELLLAGADANLHSETGRTPLHEACQGGHSRIVSMLLDYTGQVDVQDRDGRSAAHVAAFNGEVECLEILVSRGSDMVLEDKQGRQQAHLAAIRNHRNILEFLYEKGVELDCPCTLGKLPLHYAAQHGALDSLICLVERDCDITIGDKTGQLPIHYAAANNRLDCLRFLIKQGNSLEATQANGRTPAHIASIHGSLKILHWLLDKGADPNAKDNSFNTPSHLATEHGHVKCFNCLLQHNADLRATNARGDAPMDSAKKSGHPILMEKAVRNEETCPQCFAREQQNEWERKHPTPQVVKSVSRMASSAYVSPMPKAKPLAQHSELNSQKRMIKNKEKPEPTNRLPKRDLAAKYFGQYLEGDMYNLKITH